MERNSVIVYILLLVMTINVIRLLPMTLISGRFKNVFVRSFLYYVPYVTLAVMTFPAMTEITTNPIIGLIALFVGIIAAWFGMGLFAVAVLCCVIVYIAEYIFSM